MPEILVLERKSSEVGEMKISVTMLDRANSLGETLDNSAMGKT
jgi:hypothetical protein